MVQDFGESLDAIGKRVGFKADAIRFHRLRRTYTAARIQTPKRAPGWRCSRSPGSSATPRHG